VRRLLARHRTEFTYDGEARESTNEVRLCPVRHARQRVLSVSVRVTPEAEVHHHRDAFGNDVGWFQVEGPHSRLLVEAEALVEVSGHPVLPAPAGFAALEDPGLRDRLAAFLLPSALVHWPEAVDYFAQGLEPGADEVGRWLVDLEEAVNRSIVYERGHTAVDTPVERVVQARRGVCQDMAHLFIALCRRRGVPARYVSGWLHQAGRDDPAESHAWAEAWAPGTGWVEFDPTHPDPDLTHYVRVAVGRDYGDVPPFRGTYVGAPTERMDVHVEIREVDAAPGAAGGADAPPVPGVSG